MAAKSGKGKTATQRKLTAILCADVVGYSRLMGEGTRPLVYDGSMGKCRIVVVFQKFPCKSCRAVLWPLFR